MPDSQGFDSVKGNYKPSKSHSGVFLTDDEGDLTVMNGELHCFPPRGNFYWYVTEGGGGGSDTVYLKKPKNILNLGHF